MTLQDRGVRRRPHASRPWSARELANVRKLGRQWREEWQAEKAGRAARSDGSAASEPKPTSKSAAGQGFAAAIARAEFGRFYWNGSLDRRLKAAMTRHPARDRKKERR